MNASCAATKADETPCRQAGLYKCENGHVLCTNHAQRLGGAQRRRKTDRRCSICRNVDIFSLTNEPVKEERRIDAPVAATDPAA